MSQYVRYYEYDGIFHRLTYDQETHKVLKAEGYFKGDGFLGVEAYYVVREGTLITEKEFKTAVVALR